MSIIRVGLAETKQFAEGYEAIFGKNAGKKTPAPKKSRAAASNPSGKKKKKSRKK